ncbi:hypothetical protein HMPREF9120_01393 [Neisseria sp. oral taxon 020 str. F0370]|nr:hypothetical protein HMPREF9120_01393 [Neisseria sp. oral taxon 020 str. F0370]
MRSGFFVGKRQMQGENASQYRHWLVFPTRQMPFYGEKAAAIPNANSPGLADGLLWPEAV